MATSTQAIRAVKLIDGICFFVTVFLCYAVCQVTMNVFWSLVMTIIYAVVFLGSYAISEKRNERKA